MDLFTDYLHTDNDEKLADYLYPISKKYLEKTPTDERYKNGKTTFYNRNSNDYYKEELNPLINFIFKNAIKYLDVIKIDIKKNYLHLTDLWFSEMYMYGSHELHAHATEDLSGNFYIHCEEKSSSIKFFKPGFYYNKMTDLKFEEYNNYNSTMWKIPPKKGTLLMWQSSLLHSVDTNLSNSRIAVSFNLRITKI